MKNPYEQHGDFFVEHEEDASYMYNGNELRTKLTFRVFFDQKVELTTNPISGDEAREIIERHVDELIIKNQKTIK